MECDKAQDFRIEKTLSAGSFGIVAKATAFNNRLKVYGNTVVVKQLKKPELSQRDIDLFYQEISLMEYFKNCQNTAKILGYTKEPYAMIMKYYQRGNLKEWIMKHQDRRNKIHVIYFLKDICRGIEEMQSKGVIHNDLKPENILLDVDSKSRLFCVLADFGISQVVTSQIMLVAKFEKVELNGLSIAYAAPERLLMYRGFVEYKDPAVLFSWDVYSFSVISYHLLNGKVRNLYTKP